MRPDTKTQLAFGAVDGQKILDALGLKDQHVCRIELMIDASQIIECKITRLLSNEQITSLAKVLDGVRLHEPPATSRRIVPVTQNARGTYVAPGQVLAVFDTNGDGVLLEVAYRLNPIDAVEFNLVHAPYSQIYAEIKST